MMMKSELLALPFKLDKLATFCIFELRVKESRQMTNE